MADLKLRFSIYTENDDQDIDLIAQKLSKFALDKIYKKGERSTKSHFYKESSIDYVYSFDSITSLEEVNNFFIEQWREYQAVLKKLLDNDYEAYLLYEFDMDNSDVFPGMTYEVEVLRFLADTGIVLQLYYYPM